MRMHRKRRNVIRPVLIAAAIAVVATLFLLIRTPESVQLPGDQATGTRPGSIARNDRPAAPGAADKQQSLPTPEGAFPVSREDALVQVAAPTGNAAVAGQAVQRNPARTGTQADRPASCMDDLYPRAPSPASWQSYQYQRELDDRREAVFRWMPVSRLARVATDEVWNGSQSAYVAYLRSDSTVNRLHTGWLWQAVDARPLRGKRIEVSVWARMLKRDLADHFRMHAEILSGPSLEIRRRNDSTQRGLSLPALPGGVSGGGSYNWTRHAVYADVPMDADALLYAMATTGWLDDVRVSIVGEAEAIGRGSRSAVNGSTAQFPVSAEMVLPAPANLDFEEPAIADRSAGEWRNCAGGARKDADQAVDSRQ
jgi:hypothetical protein